MHSPIESQETAIVETKQGNVELELEDVWSDLHSLRKLYGLLRISGNVEEREGSENLDDKSRLLLKSLLDGATQQAFQFQAKIITKKPIKTSRTPDPPLEKINNPSSSDTKISNSSKATKEEPQNHQQLPPPLPTKNPKVPETKELMKPKIHHRRTSHGSHKHHRDLHAVRHHPSDGQAHFIIPTVSLKATPAVPGGQGKEVIQVNDGETFIPKSTAAVQQRPPASRSTVQIGRAEPPSRRMTCQKRSRRESTDVTSVPPSPYLPVRLLGPNPDKMGRQMKHKSPRKPKPVRLPSPPKSPPTPHAPRRTRKAGPTKPSLPRHRVKTINCPGGSSETSSSDSAARILPRQQQPIRTRERRLERLSHRVDSGATKRKDQRKDGRLKRIKDKLSVIFHHHHHHHHHLHHHIGDEDDHVDGPSDRRKHRSLWKYLRSAVHRTGKKDHGKLAIEGGAAKDLDRRTVKISPSHGYLHRLLEQLVRHVWRSKGRGGRANATHVRLGRRRSRLKINKLHWWQRVRRRTNKKKPRVRLGFRESVPRRLKAS